MSTVQTHLVRDTNVVILNQVLGQAVFGKDHELIIEPGRTARHIWRDLWQYRELFQVLAFVHFLISFAILVILVWYLFMPGWQILLLPVFVGIAFMAILGVWITALNVKYWDFRSFRYCAVGPLCVSLIRWSASSTDFAGACWEAKVGSTGLGSGSVSPSADLYYG